MTSPLVSIIVPCYNAEEYIEACLQSVQSQDYEQWECIVINDGSKDGTITLINEFGAKDQRFLVFSQENRGLSATRNRGMEVAKGEFIFFLDQDDILDKTAISTLVSAYDKNDIVVGRTATTVIVDGQINKVSHLLHPKEGNITFENNQFEVLRTAMESGLKPVAQNRLYRKDFIEANKLLFKDGLLHEDELWFFETMLVARRVKFIDAETYYYRIDNQASMTKNLSDRNLYAYIVIMQEILDKYSTIEKYRTIALWYAVYIKKIFLDFAIREKSKLSDVALANMEAALRDYYQPLGNDQLLSRNNDFYYKTINKLSLQKFDIIEKYFFRNKINSLRKLMLVIKINFML